MCAIVRNYSAFILLFTDWTKCMTTIGGCHRKVCINMGELCDKIRIEIFFPFRIFHLYDFYVIYATTLYYCHAMNKSALGCNLMPVFIVLFFYCMIAKVFIIWLMVDKWHQIRWVQN